MAQRKNTATPNQRMQVTDLLVRQSDVRNPFAVSVEQGSVENFSMYYGKMERMAFRPPFHSSQSSSQVWHIVDFQFQRDNARNQQILIFKADGKIYLRTAGTENEIFPKGSGNSTNSSDFAALVQKPSVVNLADRLHISDGSQYLIYDGWGFVKAGLTQPAAASASLVAGSLTGTFDFSVTQVHQRNGVRIHESPRSAVTTQSPSSQNVRVSAPATFDAKATHWSIYMSELSNSTVYRRVGTFSRFTATSDVSALPGSTQPTAPIRNDAPSPSTVLSQWKNRLVARDEQAKSNVWFSSFAEVKGLLNGAPEESYCGKGSASISDITNSWTLPESGEPLKCAVWHEELLWLFSNRNGYAVRGEGSLLDNRGIRDFFPTHIFSFGAASPWAAVSTPYGLVVMSNERNLWLWPGNGDPIDIGRDIQTRLNALSDSQLNNFEMYYWDAGGKTWLLVPLVDRIAIFDFSIRVPVIPGSPWYGYNAGIWTTVGTQSALPGNPTAFSNVNFEGKQIMLVGLDNGAVHQLDDDGNRAFGVYQPTYVGLSFIVGSTYLGALQNSANAIARTGSINPTQGFWSEGLFMSLTHRGVGDTTATGLRAPTPTLTLYLDEINPTNPTNPIILNSVTVPTTRAKRAWLAPSGTASNAGALGKRFQLEVKFTATTNDAAIRPQVVNDQVWQFAFNWMPTSDLAQ